MTIRGDVKTRDEIMKLLNLRGRRNFIENYTSPALEQGYLSLRYPDSPNRPDQAYYLTPKGLELLTKINTNK